MNFHSQLEDKSRLIYELEIKVGAPEEKLKSALSEKGSLGDYWYKQGRVEGLRIGADLGFDKGYHAAHAAFPQSRDMENLVEAYRQRILSAYLAFDAFFEGNPNLAQSYSKALCGCVKT